MCTCCHCKSMLNHNNVFSSSPPVAWPPCREGLHQLVREAAYWPAPLPSVLRHSAGAEALHRVHGCRGRNPTTPSPPLGPDRLSSTHPLPLVISGLGAAQEAGARSPACSWQWRQCGVGAISHLDKLLGETPPLPPSSPPWDQAHVRGRSPGWAGRHRPELVPRAVEVCVQKKSWQRESENWANCGFFVLTCIFVGRPAHKSKKIAAKLTDEDKQHADGHLFHWPIRPLTFTVLIDICLTITETKPHTCLESRKFSPVFTVRCKKSLF